MKKTKPLCEKPRSGVFCGPDKYLVLQKHKIKEQLYPVLERDSYFIFIRKGTGCFIINGEEFTVLPGCVAWIQASQVLTIVPDYGSQLNLWVCSYDYQLLSYWLFTQVNINDETAIVQGIPIIGPEGENVARIAELFLQFDHLGKRKGNGCAMIRSSYLRKIELLYNREAARHKAEYQPQDMPLGRRASLFMATNSTKDITLKTVAEAMGEKVSEASVNHALLISTGMNFNQYLNHLRVVLACTYFLYYSLPFDYIASIAGFDIDITFYRRFKKYTGMTPQSYREQMISSGRDGQVFRGMIISEALISAISYLYENYTEHLDMETLARDLYTSESILRIQFKDYLGTSFKEILSLFRVRYAEALLTTTDLPIIDISIESGFSSDRTMCRVFYSINGMSPGAFRKLRAERRDSNG